MQLSTQKSNHIFGFYLPPQHICTFRSLGSHFHIPNLYVMSVPATNAIDLSNFLKGGTTSRKKNSQIYHPHSWASLQELQKPLLSLYEFISPTPQFSKVLDLHNFNADFPAGMHQIRYEIFMKVTEVQTKLATECSTRNTQFSRSSDN